MLHPSVLAALVLLVVNDHVLKGWWPGVITGKLSDVAGLVFFPVLLATLTGMRAPIACVIATGVVFALVKTVPACADAYAHAIGFLQWPVRAIAGKPYAAAAVVVDPTDLVALPALALPAWLLVRARRARAQTEAST